MTALWRVAFIFRVSCHKWLIAVVGLVLCSVVEFSELPNLEWLKCKSIALLKTCGSPVTRAVLRSTVEPMAVGVSLVPIGGKSIKLIWNHMLHIVKTHCFLCFISTHMRVINRYDTFIIVLAIFQWINVTKCYTKALLQALLYCYNQCQRLTGNPLTNSKTYDQLRKVNLDSRSMSEESESVLFTN